MTTKASPAADAAPEEKEEAAAKAALRSAAADKRKCPVCLLSACPKHWGLFKKEGGAA